MRRKKRKRKKIKKTLTSIWVLILLLKKLRTYYKLQVTVIGQMVGLH